MIPDFLLDFGNTSCKVARLVQGKPAEILRFPHAFPPDLPIPPGAGCVLAGSAPRVQQEWEHQLNQMGCPTRIIKRSDIPLKLKMEDPSTVGIDRLLGALGAQHLHPGKTVLVADAGTAITLNLVDRDGVFQGGAILPGLGLMARSLSQNTEQLPHVNFRKSIPDFPASTTPKALRLGIFLAAAGAIHRALATVASFDENTILVLTGSDACFLAQEFPQAVLEPFLVHLGMLACLGEES